MRAIIYPRIIRDSAGIADHGEHRKIVEGNNRLRTMRMDKGQQKYVYGIGKVGDAVKLLLDPDKLLNDDDLSVAEQANDMILGEE